MGKQDYKYSDKVRFGQLPKEDRKAVSKVVNKSILSGSFANTAVCTGEIGDMLTCFESHDWDTSACMKEIDVMHSCVDVHKHDPDPRKLARQWQNTMKMKVFDHFVKSRVLGRIR